MPNIIKSNHVFVNDDSIKVIDSNLRENFRPIQYKTATQLEDTDDYDPENGLTNEEELFQMNHSLNGSEKLHHMQSMAEQILEEAKTEAERLKQASLAQAANELERLREEAKEAGYQEGYASGVQAVEEERKSIEQLKQQQQTDYDNKLIDMQANVTEILVAYISKITGVIIEDKDIIHYLVTEAVRGQSSCNDYRIRVSKEDYPYVLEHIEEYKSYLKRTAEISVSEDMDLEKNQCFIETDKNIIDCSIETKINNLVTALKLLTID